MKSILVNCFVDGARYNQMLGMRSSAVEPLFIRQIYLSARLSVSTNSGQQSLNVAQKLVDDMLYEILTSTLWSAEMRMKTSMVNGIRLQWVW